MLRSVITTAIECSVIKERASFPSYAVRISHSGSLAESRRRIALRSSPSSSTSNTLVEVGATVPRDVQEVRQT